MNSLKDHNIFCSFNMIAEGLFRCSKCGRSIEILDGYEDPPMILCQALLDRNLSGDSKYVENIRNISDTNNSLEEVADDDLIVYRHNICMGCEFYKNNVCEKCGCNISRVKSYANKLASKNSRCPIDKW